MKTSLIGTKQIQINGRTNLYYKDEEPFAVTTTERNFDRAKEDAEEYHGAPLELGRWERHNTYTWIACVYGNPPDIYNDEGH